MFGEVDANVRAFLEAHADAPVTFEAHRAEGDDPRVHAYLLALDVPDQFRNLAPAPVQVLLRYVVTVYDPEPQQAHDRLGKLVFAAMDSDTFRTDLRPLPIQTWAALGVPPQPCLQLEAVARRVRESTQGPPVRALLLRLERTAGRVSGVVRTPEGRPFPRAEVVLAAVGRRTHTDNRGRFSFTNVPQPLEDDRVEVRAKGFEAIAHAGPEPIEVRLGPKE